METVLRAIVFMIAVFGLVVAAGALASLHMWFVGAYQVVF